VRGQLSDPGETRTSPNGYHYTKTSKGWRMTHHIMMEQHIGRPIKLEERVVFKDKDRTNLEVDNLELQVKGRSTAARELARLEARRDELEARITELREKLET